MSPLIAVIIMPGFVIAGWSDDATGSFVTALRIFVMEIIVASLLLIALKLPSAPVAEGKTSGS